MDHEDGTAVAASDSEMSINAEVDYFLRLLRRDGVGLAFVAGLLWVLVRLFLAVVVVSGSGLSSFSLCSVSSSLASSALSPLLSSVTSGVGLASFRFLAAVLWRVLRVVRAVAVAAAFRTGVRARLLVLCFTLSIGVLRALSASEPLSASAAFSASLSSEFAWLSGTSPLLSLSYPGLLSLLSPATAFSSIKLPNSPHGRPKSRK